MKPCRWHHVPSPLRSTLEQHIPSFKIVMNNVKKQYIGEQSLHCMFGLLVMFRMCKFILPQ